LIHEIVPSRKATDACSQLVVAAEDVVPGAFVVVISERFEEARQISEEIVVVAGLHLRNEPGVLRAVLHIPKRKPSIRCP
jgi:hypothetical protein